MCSDPCSPIWSTGEATRDDWVAVTVADGMVLTASSPESPIEDALSAYALAPRTRSARRGADRGAALVYVILALFAASVLLIRLLRSRGI